MYRVLLSQLRLPDHHPQVSFLLTLHILRYYFSLQVLHKNKNKFSFTVFVTKIMDPDPQLEKILDPDPQLINADPKPCLVLSTRSESVRII